MMDHLPDPVSFLVDVGGQERGRRDTLLDLGEEVLRQDHPSQRTMDLHPDISQSEADLFGIGKDQLPACSHRLPSRKK